MTAESFSSFKCNFRRLYLEVLRDVSGCSARNGLEDVIVDMRIAALEAKEVDQSIKVHVLEDRAGGLTIK